MSIILHKLVKHPGFREMINSVLTATTAIMLIASAKIPEQKGRISPSSFYGQLPDY